MKQTCLIAILALFIGCTNQKNEASTETPKEVAIPGYITLIINKPAVKDGIEVPNGVKVTAPSYLTYSDDDYFRHQIDLEKDMVDTLTISSKRPYLEIAHQYNVFHRASYLLQSGDTLRLDYTDSLPNANILNRKTSLFDLNYEAKRNEHFYPNDYPPQFKLNFPLAFMNRNHSGGISAAYDELNETYKPEVMSFLMQERRYLDSLLKSQQIDAAYHQYYKAKNTYDLLGTSLTYDISPVQSSNASEKNLNDSLINYKPKVTDIKYLIAQSDDSLLHNKFYKDFLYDYIHYQYTSKIEIIKSSNGARRDTRAIFDSIQADKSLSEKAKQFLLFDQLKQIIPNFSVEDGQRYFKKYVALRPDSSFIKALVTTYDLSSEISDELALKDLDGNSVTFSDLLAQNKGNMLYVDFWASWCAPCIRAFPASHKLAETYKNKDITFVYISTDEDKQKWMKAAQKHNILKNSYVIDNKYTSLMLEELEMKSIPRYLLFNKSGKLVHKKAPDPGSSETAALFDQYLGE